jgi:hypothetical protein
MSKLIIITPGMHKIVNLQIKVKYKKPGNVIEYIPVEFEVFRKGEHLEAVPLINANSRLLTNLPNEILFQVKNGKIKCCTPGREEVVSDLAKKMIEMDLMEDPFYDLREVKTNCFSD